MTEDALAARIEAALTEHGLQTLGGFHPGPRDDIPAATLLLIGPEDRRFWPIFQAAPEAGDGAPDPLDRWSRRVIGTLACSLGAKARFPFGGPPWHPFLAWAERTGRIHRAPVPLLVHAQAGLFISFRGALLLQERVALPPPLPSPCTGCPAPCRSACPVGALTETGYDVPTCRSHIATPAGSDCLEAGCAVRRACPVGAGARQPAQSAFHMKAFQG